MITASRLKIATAALAALAMAACSSGYDRYGDSAYGDSYGSYGTGYGGNSFGDMSGYGMMGSNCVPGMMGAQYGGMNQYGGGYTSGGLRSGGRYGSDVIATGNVEFYGQKSRYGTSGQTSMSGAGCNNTGMSGYWMAPTYQVVQQPPAVTTTVPAPVMTTIQESCPDGQYRMDNGDCAIMMTEETEQYVPPVTSTIYPEVTAPTVDWYNPIRK